MPRKVFSHRRCSPAVCRRTGVVVVLRKCRRFFLSDQLGREFMVEKGTKTAIIEKMVGVFSYVALIDGSGNCYVKQSPVLLLLLPLMHRFKLVRHILGSGINILP